jgi:hypothetical protein
MRSPPIKPRGSLRFGFRRLTLLLTTLLTTLALLSVAAPLRAAESGEMRLLVQSSPLAGFRHYAGETFWSQLREGDALTLIREPDNPHDANAVRIEWRGHQLGYLPRAENRAVAAAMDAGEPIDARIARLRVARNPWQRILVDVYVRL